LLTFFLYYDRVIYNSEESPRNGPKACAGPKGAPIGRSCAQSAIARGGKVGWRFFSIFLHLVDKNLILKEEWMESEINN